MITRVKTASYFGIEPFLVDVEVDIARGLPIFNIVGLGDTAILESRERVKSALRNTGFELKLGRITINLTPANKRKIGSHFDLPIAVGLMCSQGLISFRKDILDSYLFLGELSLSGDLIRTQGIINSVILAKEMGYKGVVIPRANKKEGSLVQGLNIITVKNLKEVQEFLESGYLNTSSEEKEDEILMDNSSKDSSQDDLDFYNVRGQEKAKRGLEISAAGGHNILMIGSPGTGKTMLAKRITSILPDLDEDERLEVTKLYSIAGKLDEDEPIIRKRPFRSPHHTSSGISIIGGGAIPRLGEITLANRGVLFLDEIVEFKKDILENLREPLEEKKIEITRAGYRVTFPTDFILVAASNPCKCGNYFEDNGSCTCTAGEVSKYMKKLSGPILDRIDLKIEMTRVSSEELLEDTIREKSRDIKLRVEEGRLIQRKRFGSKKLNSSMTKLDIEKYCKLSDEGKSILKKAMDNLKLSARAVDRTLKVARTIADLANSKNIEKSHLLEAITYRMTENI